LILAIALSVPPKSREHIHNPIQRRAVPLEKQVGPDGQDKQQDRNDQNLRDQNKLYEPDNQPSNENNRKKKYFEDIHRV
jgi:hypothetical protein